MTGACARRQRFVRMDGGLSSLAKEGSVYMVLNDSEKLDATHLRVLAAILQRPDVAPRCISLDLRRVKCSISIIFLPNQCYVEAVAAGPRTHHSVMRHLVLSSHHFQRSSRNVEVLIHASTHSSTNPPFP